MIDDFDYDSTMLSLLSFEDEKTAFIKSDYKSEHQIWEIYGADGTKLAATDNRDYAFLLAKQNDFNPQSVH